MCPHWAASSSASGSMSASATHSSILWLVALTGPISSSCGQISAMKRPSEVPPVVDSSVSMPQISWIAAVAASASGPRLVRKGLAPSVQSIA